MNEIRHRETGETLFRLPSDPSATARLRRRKLAGADFHEANLRGADLYRADLSRANLEGAMLERARATGLPPELGTLLHWGIVLGATGLYIGHRMDSRSAHPAIWFLALALWPLLTGAMLPFLRPIGRWPRPRASVGLRGARMQGVNLTNADLPLADLEGADLRNAAADGINLMDANLRRSDLRDAWMVGADLSGAKAGHPCRPSRPPGADPRSADLRRADLTRARLFCTDLRGADLRATNLADANLTFADLRGADLRSARLTQANLRYADLREADVRGADLRAQLDGAKLQGARYDETTRWPSSFRPGAYGCITAAEVTPAPIPHGRGDEPNSTSRCDTERSEP